MTCVERSVSLPDRRSSTPVTPVFGLAARDRGTYNDARKGSEHDDGCGAHEERSTRHGGADVEADALLRLLAHLRAVPSHGGLPRTGPPAAPQPPDLRASPGEQRRAARPRRTSRGLDAAHAARDPGAPCTRTARGAARL